MLEGVEVSLAAVGLLDILDMLVVDQALFANHVKKCLVVDLPRKDAKKQDHVIIIMIVVPRIGRLSLQVREANVQKDEKARGVEVEQLSSQLFKNKEGRINLMILCKEVFVWLAIS